MNAETILELRAVTVPTRRDAETASTKGADWSVRAGELWIVGGPQGSGKSDFMFMLAGLARPLGGAFHLFGHDMARPFGEEFLPARLRLGVVFDDARLFNHLTIAENISLPARYHHDLHEDETARWTQALLRATDLVEFADSTPDQLTRNWRRRAALARALALRPELLLIENAQRGLDAHHAAWWVEFLIRLWSGHDLLGGRPMTIIISVDEFDPWHESGAQFATLHDGQFTVAGERAPADPRPMNQGN